MSISERIVTITVIIALVLIGGHLLTAGSTTEPEATPAPNSQTAIY